MGADKRGFLRPVYLWGKKRVNGIKTIILRRNRIVSVVPLRRVKCGLVMVGIEPACPGFSSPFSPIFSAIIVKTKLSEKGGEKF